jgi:hypothetical protein
MDEHATPVDWERIVLDPGPSFVEEFDGYYGHLFDSDSDDVCGDLD